MKFYKWYTDWRQFGLGIVTNKNEYEFSFELDTYWDLSICTFNRSISIQIGTLYFNFTKYPKELRINLD